MKGTIVNAAAIIAGSSLGICLGRKFSSSLKKTLLQSLSLAVILIGVQMALESEEIVVVIFSLIIGGLIGEIIGIEKKLKILGAWIQNKFAFDNGNIAEAFVRTTLIYCVGAMSIMGAIQDGLTGSPDILYAKSMLDGVSAIAFTSTMGIGVIFSSLSVFIYQGLITLLATSLQFLLTPEIVAEMTATGGLLIIAISINILGMAEIKVGNLLPSIGVAVILAYFII